MEPPGTARFRFKIFPVVPATSHRTASPGGKKIIITSEGQSVWPAAQDDMPAAVETMAADYV